jgi:hypothetical protein
LLLAVVVITETDLKDRPLQQSSLLAGGLPAMISASELSLLRRSSLVAPEPVEINRVKHH